MNLSLITALIGAVINMVLSIVIPCLINKSNQPFLVQIKAVYETNRQLILVSSLIIAITIYMAMEFAPNIKELMDSDVFEDYDNDNDLFTGGTHEQLENLRQMGGNF